MTKQSSEDVACRSDVGERLKEGSNVRNNLGRDGKGKDDRCVILT